MDGSGARKSVEVKSPGHGTNTNGQCRGKEALSLAVAVLGDQSLGERGGANSVHGATGGSLGEAWKRQVWEATSWTKVRHQQEHCSVRELGTTDPSRQVLSMECGSVISMKDTCAEDIKKDNDEAR